MFHSEGVKTPHDTHHPLDGLRISFYIFTSNLVSKCLLCLCGFSYIFYNKFKNIILSICTYRHTTNVSLFVLQVVCLVFWCTTHKSLSLDLFIINCIIKRKYLHFLCLKKFSNVIDIKQWRCKVGIFFLFLFFNSPKRSAMAE